MQHKLVAVIGNVASGKSTLAPKLAKELRGVFIPADELYKVNPFFSLAVEDRRRWSLASDLWFLKERVKLAREAEEKLELGHVVVDSGLQMSWVYANSRIRSGYFNEEEGELYKEMFEVSTNKIKGADLLVYLKVNVGDLIRRIKKRGREFEIKNHSRKYLKSIEMSIEEYVNQHDKTNKVHVEGKIDFDEVYAEIKKQL